ncbi:MAG: hypothetical protein AB7G06_06950 [Bdellovibrionales bacterium]
MASIEKIEHICSLLHEQYGADGDAAAKNLRHWISGKAPLAHTHIIERHLDQQHLALVFDAFRQMVPFGTAGRRGPVGYGPNRINHTTIALTVQGHCDYLRAMHKDKPALTVIVGNDMRIFKDFKNTYAFLNDPQHPLANMTARSLAELACEIYAGNGITAYVRPIDDFDGLLPTPELSYLIRKLGAIGAVQMSASHNPPDDNGLKLYDEFGSQAIAPHDEILVKYMDDVTTVRTMPFHDALKNGLVKWIPADGNDDYIDLYLKIFDGAPRPDPDIPVVYAALNGCGEVTAGALLRKAGFTVLTMPGDGPDGTFASVPLKTPNPEVGQSTEAAKKFADKNNCGVVLSSDPDVDRVGLEAKLADGSWHHFDGNQIAVILCHFLTLHPKGPRRKGLIVETFVTTKLLREIAHRTGGPVVDNLMVGMKFIGNVLKELDAKGEYQGIKGKAQDLVFAAEESHGISVTDLIREKDAAGACIYLACIYQILKREGLTLLDYYISILRDLGGYETIGRSIAMTGIEGVRMRDKIMESLRANPPQAIAGRPVRDVTDFWDEVKFGKFLGSTDILGRNAVQLGTDDFLIVVRPSGTEPKLKIYCHMLPQKNGPAITDIDSLHVLKRHANGIASHMYGDLLARIGASLGPAALLLPDIVDVDRKVRFEKTTLPALRERLLGNSNLDEILQWLRQETASMTPGADPLPALRDSVAYQCGEWAKQAGSSPALDNLMEWASAA